MVDGIERDAQFPDEVALRAILVPAEEKIIGDDFKTPEMHCHLYDKVATLMLQLETGGPAYRPWPQLACLE